MAETTQTPVELAAAAILGALSTVALGATVDAGSGWTEELGLYIMVVMAAAERKSTVMRLVTSPLREIEEEVRAEMEEELRDARATKAALEHRRRHVLSKYAKADDPEDRRELWETIKDLDQRISKFGELPDYRILADDVTAEGLTRLLALHGRIGILSAEGTAVDNIVGGRYNDGPAKLDILLKAYSGEPHTVDRRGREPEVVTRPLLSVTLAVQESYLQDLVDHSRARSLGLVSRFVLLAPRSRVGARSVQPPALDKTVSQAWTRRLRLVHQAGKDSPALKLDARAKEVLHEDLERLEKQLGMGGDLAPVADWAGRHYGRVLRISGLLHLAEGHAANDQISRETYRRARQIGEWIMAHGLAALTDPDSAYTRAISVLERWPHDTITQRDLHRQVYHARGPVDQTTQLISRLIEDRLIWEQPVDRPTTGRPPSPAYYIVREETTP